MTEETVKGPARRGYWAYVPVLVFGGLVLAFFLALRAGDPSRLPSTLVGNPAPALDLAPLEGLLRDDGSASPGLSSADLAGGGVTLVNVWASWCAPCRAEHPLLMRLAEEEGLRLVGINYKDDVGNARRFLGALGNPFDAVGVDPRGRASIDWGVYGVPETFVVDGKGVVRLKHVGPIDEAALAGTILPAVAEATAGGS